jgi:hypothetical protein
MQEIERSEEQSRRLEQTIACERTAIQAQIDRLEETIQCAISAQLEMDK